MDFRQLEYAVAVADRLSFTQAAQDCHVVQSALSHQIQRLEAELGIKLFERTSRRVQVTDAGAIFLPRARQILSGVGDLHSDLDAFMGLERGSLAIGETQSAGRVLDLIASLGTFNERYPNVELRVMSGPASELTSDVRGGLLDVAFVSYDSADSAPAEGSAGTTVVTLVTYEPLVAVVGLDHPRAGRSQVSLGDLAESGRMVVFRGGTELRRTVDRALESAGVSRTGNLELGRISDMVRFASHCQAAAIVPDAFARQPPAGADGYRTLRLREKIGISVCAVLRDSEPSPALRGFMELVTTELKNRSSRSKQ